jgi:hypothetical protein
MKRRYFFEANRQHESETRYELPDPRALFAYRHFAGFVDALLGKTSERDLLGTVVEGISRADGVPSEAAGGSLALKAIETSDEELQVIKRFSVEEFRFRRPRASAAFAEGLEDLLMLEHVTGSPVLTINLDLFEFLGRARDGFLPGAEEQRPLQEDLRNFKNQLLARPTREVVIIERGRRAHRIRVEADKLVRVGAET